MAAEKLITLEEAAQRLEITPAMFRQKLQTDTAFKTISKIRDGSTFRFKPSDIEELRRSLGFGSEEELQLVDPSSDEMTIPTEFNLADDDAPKSTKAASSKKKIPAPKPTIEDDDANVLRLTEAELDLDKDVFLMADDEPAAKKSSGKLRSPPKKGDSDVRLGQSGKVKRLVAEEPSDEVELDILPSLGSSSKLSGSGKMSSSKIKPVSSTKLSPPKSSKSIKDADSSEFELNLDADSSDEFELSLADDDSDEISLGDMPAPSEGDSKAGLASGINIGRPKDAGLSLERGDGRSSKKLPSVKPSGPSSKKLPPVKLPPDNDEEIDFELSLDQPGSSSKKLSASSKKIEADDSEFDLNLDDSAEISAIAEDDSFEGAAVVDDDNKNDIFETDFEIPALDDDSASEAVAIDEADTDLESSDFDLAIDDSGEIESDDESGSQVVVLDDEIEADEAPRSKKSAKRKKAAVVADDDADFEGGDAVSFDDMDLDESVSASRALKGLRQADVEAEPVERVVILPNAPWGALPAIVLLPTVFIIFVAGLMAYEMMHSMWGYHQPAPPSSVVIDQVSDILDMKPKEQ